MGRMISTTQSVLNGWAAFDVAVTAVFLIGTAIDLHLRRRRS